MSQSISRRSFLKCAGSGAVSLAAALLTGVCAAAQQPCLAGEPALLDGKAAVELLGYAPAPELGGVLVYLSVENLSAASLPVDTSYLQSRGLRTREQLYSMGTGVTAVIQSSSATSVMVVGFVNSGMMKVRQAIGVIMGAILGTSVTGWILCLNSISGGSGSGSSSAWGKSCRMQREMTLLVSPSVWG